MQTKASEMAGLIMALEERDVRLSAAQGELVVAVLRAVLEACGVRVTEAVRRALGEALRGATEDGESVILVSPSTAEEAARDVREGLERLQLPEPVDEPVIDGQLDIVTAIEKVEPDVPDAEVIAPPPLPDGWLQMHHGDEAAARAAFERYSSEEREREARKRDAPDAWRTGRGGGIGGPMTEVFRPPAGSGAV